MSVSTFMSMSMVSERRRADLCRQWLKFDTTSVNVNVMVISGRLSRMSMN